jgi:hypothetical protein
VRLVALLRRLEFAREKLCYLRQLQRVRSIAVDATEFTSSHFDKHESHRLVALRTYRGRRIPGHGRLQFRRGRRIIAIYLVGQTAPS